MKTTEFQFSTGRDYGQPQVINVRVLSGSFDDLTLFNFVAVFEDVARGISGKVSTFSYTDSQMDVERAIMMEYDACRYVGVF